MTCLSMENKNLEIMAKQKMNGSSKSVKSLKPSFSKSSSDDTLVK